MECQRLNKMIRTWYVQVQGETLAPARMVEFMEEHVENCDECLMDPGIREELKKITAIVLPPSKMTKPPKRATKDMPQMPTAKDLEAIKGDEEKGQATDEDTSTGDELDNDDIEVDGDDGELENADADEG